MNMTLQTNVKATATPALVSTPFQNRLLQRKCSRCSTHSIDDEREDDQKKRLNLQRRTTNESGPDMVPPIVHEVLRLPGEPLPQEIRAYMEPRFGHDFSKVRVHADSRAAESAQAVNARAFTVGNDVVFGEGLYRPAVHEGRKLLAHELAHTIQQSSTPMPADIEISHPASPSELEAENAARSVMAGQAFDRINLMPSVLARQDDPDAGTSEIHDATPSGGVPEQEKPPQQAPPPQQQPAPVQAPAAASTVAKSGPATCDDGAQMFCNTGNKGCPTFEKGMTAAWANICYRCGPKGVYHRNKDEGTGVVRVGCGDTLTVTSQDDPDCSIKVRVIDHGPRGSTGNLVDLHPAAAEKLWKCANKKAKGKFRCDNFKMPVSVSATENTCPEAPTPKEKK